MTKIRSVIIDSGSGSVGNVTMRYAGGQTILSKRIISNKSRSDNQIKQRNGFGESSSIAKSLMQLIDVGYKKTATWSKRNAFIHYNKSIINYAKENAVYNPELPPITNLCVALGDSAFKGKIYSAYGEYNLKTSFEWKGEASLEGILLFGRSFQAGDKITLALCYSYMEMDDFYEYIKTFEKTLTDEDIKALPNHNKFLLNKTTFPGIDVFGDIPKEAKFLEILGTGIVTGEKSSSTSILIPLPDMLYYFGVDSFEEVGNRQLILKLTKPELFMEAIGDIAVGCVLKYDYRAEGGLESFVVTSISKGADNKVIGPIVDAPQGKQFTEDVYISDTGVSMLYRDEEPLAEMEIFLFPKLEAIP